jgi:hypothetical protein
MFDPWCPIANKRGTRGGRDFLRESATTNIPRRIALLRCAILAAAEWVR